MTAIHPQFIKAGHEELVVLTRAEFDMLTSIAERDEDLDDIARFDARMSDLADGRDVALPPEVNAALLRGSSLLEALRLWRGLDFAEIASRAGARACRQIGDSPFTGSRIHRRSAPMELTDATVRIA